MPMRTHRDGFFPAPSMGGGVHPVLVAPSTSRGLVHPLSRVAYDESEARRVAALGGGMPIPSRQPARPLARKAPPVAYLPDAETLYRISRTINIPDQATLNGGASGVETAVNFQQDGYIIGLRLDAKNSTSTIRDRARLAIKIQAQGQETALTTDGKSAAFIPLPLLLGQGEPVDAAPLVRRVRVNDKLNVTFLNLDPVFANTATPCGGFLFVSDEDLPEGCLFPGPVETVLPGCTRFLLVPNQSFAAGAIAGGADGLDGVLEFQSAGHITAFRTTPINDASPEALSNYAVQLETFGDLTALTSDGFALAFTQANVLCGGKSAYAPYVKYVNIYDKIRMKFRNTGAAALSPQGCFHFVADKDLEADHLGG